MLTFPSSIKEACSSLLAESVTDAAPLSGGDIHRAHKLIGQSGKALFVKWNPAPNAPDMFRTETEGLSLLARAEAIHIPKILGTGKTADGAFLLLEFIDPGSRTTTFWERFGRELARLHRYSDASFGWEIDNYIGTLPQRNSTESDWVSFFVLHRLEPQVKMAIEEGYFDSSSAGRFQQLFSRLDKLLPDEPPALIHGDLWAGNFIAGKNDTPWLIDPAPGFAHREMDLAMSRLFGGFDREFYLSYESEWPLEPGFSDRMDLYQLYYLLVHVNLFGGHYPGQVRSILKKYL